MSVNGETEEEFDGVSLFVLSISGTSCHIFRTLRTITVVWMSNGALTVNRCLIVENYVSYYSFIYLFDRKHPLQNHSLK